MAMRNNRHHDLMRRLRSSFNIEIFTRPGSSGLQIIEKKIQESQYQMVAVKALIRKARIGEIDMEQLKKEVRPKIAATDTRAKDFIRQLDLIAKRSREEPLKDDNKLPPCNINASEDEKKILLFNKKKRYEVLRHDANLLMEVALEKKKLSREHHLVLRKEHAKLVTDPDCL